MTKTQAMPYVSFLLDDALAERSLSAILPNARLVGWQCGFEPMFVAVQSYLPNVRLDDEEAKEIAIDFLRQRNWFAGNCTPKGEEEHADYII